MIYLTLVSLIWALSFGLIKGKLTTLDPNFVAAARLLLAFLVFLPFLRFGRVSRPQFLRLALIGALQYGLMYVLYTWSYQLLKAYEVALFTILTPLYVTLIDAALERRLRSMTLLAVLITMIGTAICTWKTLTTSSLLLGILAVQGANLCFALGQVLYRRLMPSVPAKDHQVFATLYLGGFLVAGVALLFSFKPAHFTLTPIQAASLIYLGIIASGLGFFLWNLGARRTNVGALAIFNDLKIPLGMLASALIFGETVESWPRLLLGGAIIALALYLNERSLHPRVQA